MSCERYKTVIVEAAASGEVGPPLRLHLEGCAECRAALADEQSLFSAIDASLSQRMNASPSPEFIPRIRSVVDLENSGWSVRGSNVWFRWLPIAGATVAACLALLFFVRHHSVAPERQQPVANVLAPEMAETQVRPPKAGSEHEPALRSMAGTMKRPAKRGLQSNADRIEPEILVSPEERVALVQFVAGLSKRREIALALARPAPFEPQPETPPGGPLEIAKLEVPPLIPIHKK
jgi:hypothetical protein